MALKIWFNITQGLKAQEIGLLHIYRYRINCRGNAVQMRPDGGYKYWLYNDEKRP